MGSILDDLLLHGINSGFKAINEAKKSVLLDVEKAVKVQRVKVEQKISEAKKRSGSETEPIEAEFIEVEEGK